MNSFELKLMPQGLVKLENVVSEKFSYNSFYEKGVYIWGFNFDNESQFYPYYVGQAGGVKNSNNTILKRLKHEFNFKDPYNVIKSEFLKEFIKEGYLKTDAWYNTCSDVQREEYRSYFAYLNKKPYPEKWGSTERLIYKALNNKKEQFKHLDHIKYMQERMYVCWIPISDDIKTRKDCHKIILELEKHVHNSIKVAGFKLSGQVKHTPSKEYSFKISFEKDDLETCIKKWKDGFNL